MTTLETLSEEEELVLRLIKKAGKPIGEHEFHMIVSISVNVAGLNLYQFEPNVWESIDEQYETGLGHIPYSAKLHEQIESLIKKGYLIRDNNKPIIIYENKQLRLF